MPETLIIVVALALCGVVPLVVLVVAILGEPKHERERIARRLRFYLRDARARDEAARSAGAEVSQGRNGAETSGHE